MPAPPPHRAAAFGFVEGIRVSLGAGYSPEATNRNGCTAMHVAAENGHVSVIEELLSAGANPEAMDNDGTTPLHFAACHGHEAAVVSLMAAPGRGGRTEQGRAYGHSFRYGPWTRRHYRHTRRWGSRPEHNRRYRTRAHARSCIYWSRNQHRISRRRRGRSKRIR